MGWQHIQCASPQIGEFVRSIRRVFNHSSTIDIPIIVLGEG
jgi:hypothetical protein